MSTHEDPTRNGDAESKPGRAADGTAVPRHLVDAFFDRELDPPARLELFALLRKDLASAVQMERTQEVVDALREPEARIDLTPRILKEWEARRAAGFVPTPAQREAVRSTRVFKMNVLLLAASLALVVGGIVFLRLARFSSPQLTTQPLSASVVPDHAPVPSETMARPVPSRPTTLSPRTLTLLRPGDLSVRALPKVQSGSFQVLGGAGDGSIFSWAEFGRRDPFASRVASTRTLLDGWANLSASRASPLSFPAFGEPILVPSARTAPVIPEPTTRWR
jgi:hypothetical protein